jgi:PAS domain-containing protein
VVPQDSVNFAIMLATSALLLTEGLVAWRRLRFAGGRALALALFVGAAEAFCYALVFYAVEGPTMLRLAAVYAVTGPPLATFWFIFAWRFAGLRRLSGRWPAVVLVAAAVGLVVAAALKPALIYPQSRGLTALSFAHGVVRGDGALFAVQLTWFSGLIVAGVVLLLTEALRSFHLCRRQALVVIAGVGVAFALDVAFMSGYAPIRGLHLGLVAFAAGVLPLIWALPRLRALDLFAVWQPRILEDMSDAVLVADGEGNIVNANRAAQRLLAAGRPDVRPAQRLDECDWFAGLDACELNEAVPTEPHSLGAESGCTVTVRLDGRPHHLNVRQSALRDGRGRELSRVLVLRDVTEHAESAAAAGDSAHQLNVLLDRLDEANQDLRTLVDAGREFGGSLKPEDVLGAVVRRMRELTGASRCSLYRFEGECMTALVTADGEAVTEDCTEFSFALAGHPITCQAVRTMLPVGVPDAATDAGLSDAERADAARLGYRASLDLPLVNGGKVVGLLELVDAQPREFDHAELLRGLAPIAAQAIVNAQVYAEQRQTARRLALVSDVSTLFSSTSGCRRRAAVDLQQPGEITGTPICSVYVRRRRRPALPRQPLRRRGRPDVDGPQSFRPRAVAVDQARARDRQAGRRAESE